MLHHDIRRMFETIKDRLGIKRDVTLSIGFSNPESNPSHYTYSVDGSGRICDEHVYLNMRNCRTFRDVVFVLGHELGHAKDYKNVMKRVQEQTNVTHGEKDYWNLPTEVTANTYGLRMARELDYKNRVVNHDQKTSLFVTAASKE